MSFFFPFSPSFICVPECHESNAGLTRVTILFYFVDEEEIPETSVELYLLDKLKARIQLAREIDSAQHKVKKENHEKNWLREAAEAMELEIDSDMGLRFVSF